MNNQGNCSKCNNLNVYTAQFCTVCGERLPWAQNQSVSVPVAAAVKTPMNPTTKIILGCVVAVGCLIPLIISIMVFIGLTIAGSKTPNTFNKPTPTSIPN